MTDVVKQIRKTLKAETNPERIEGIKHFFRREEIEPYGLTGDRIKELSKEYYQQVRHLKRDIFPICEELLESGMHEESCFAFKWAFKQKRYYEENDFLMFEKWLKKYVKNWAMCDDFSTHVIGYHLMQFPSGIERTVKWRKSKNRWVRRSSAVSFIYPARRDMYLDTIFDVAEELLEDEDYMVQKGYGWLLKDASLLHMKEVDRFVMKNKDRMPRTALRYAIERFDKDRRAKAMAK